MEIYAIACGHRNICDPEQLHKILSSSSDLDTFLDAIQTLATNGEISNSEVALALSAYGASSEGANVQFLRLNQIIDVQGSVNQNSINEFRQIIEESNGIILGAPLHFGNPSSYLLRMLSILSEIQTFPFTDKVLGQATVGARRNGGQEAGNIFSLLECAQLGAAVVGDGPPFSQSGGILESRHSEAALKDVEGAKTCINIGARVTRALHILRPYNVERPVKITIITDGRSSSEFARKNLIHYTSNKAIFNVVNLEDHNIERCIGCSECPVETKRPYRCIIEDSMEKVEGYIVDSDGLIVCLEAKSQLWSSYHWQTFIERSRYLRRDNYRLANIPIMSIQYCSDITTFPFHARIIPPCFKHDMIFVGPCITGYSGMESGRFLENLNRILDKFSLHVMNAKTGRIKFPYATLYEEEARRFV